MKQNEEPLKHSLRRWLELESSQGFVVSLSVLCSSPAPRFFVILHSCQTNRKVYPRKCHVVASLRCHFLAEIPKKKCPFKIRISVRNPSFFGLACALSQKTGCAWNLTTLPFVFSDSFYFPWNLWECFFRRGPHFFQDSFPFQLPPPLCFSARPNVYFWHLKELVMSLKWFQTCTRGGGFPSFFFTETLP